MKLKSLVLLGSLVCLALQLATAAENEPDKPKASQVPFNGKLLSIDKAAQTITLQGKEKQRVIQLTAATRFKRQGQASTLDDGKPGEDVGGLLKKTDDGKWEAISVRFGPKPEKPEGTKEERKAKREARKKNAPSDPK